jgi:hypothetical protein
MRNWILAADAVLCTRQTSSAASSYSSLGCQQGRFILKIKLEVMYKRRQSRNRPMLNAISLTSYAVTYDSCLAAQTTEHFDET